MDDQTLERLMIDDAVGALPEDVSALLAAYGATLPNGGGVDSGRWRDVAKLASRAMDGESGKPAGQAKPAHLEPHSCRGGRASR